MHLQRANEHQDILEVERLAGAVLALLPNDRDAARRVLMSALTRTKMRGDRPDNLSPRELQFLRSLATGSSYQQISERLGVSINTVRNYARSSYEKLGVHTKSEAVAKALKLGWI